MSLKLNSSGGGSVTLQEPVTASDLTVNLPAANGTVQLEGAPVNIGGNNISAVNSLGFRNRIINGNMVIDQRNAGASFSFAANTSAYTLDRWSIDNSTDGSLTVQQSTVAPTGFTNSILVTVTSADSSLASGQRSRVFQRIEGFNSADLAWGTANAIAVTISFWVRSSLTGTFGGALRNGSSNRSYAFTYSISSANTWEYKTVNIAGDTTGTWATGNTSGIEVGFGFGASSDLSGTAGTWTATANVSATGATSVVGTNGATWQVTGVQLEAGTVATPFEQIDYGRELIMCQRYYQTIGDSANNFVGVSGSSGAYTTIPIIYPVKMRTAGSVTLSTAPSGAYAGGIKDNSFYLSANQATMVGPMLALISSEL
jgi:hypothetical protein